MALAGINSNDSQIALEDMVNNNGNVVATRILIARQLADRGVSIKSGELLYSSYCKETNADLRNELRRLLLLAPKDQVYQGIKSSLNLIALPGPDLAIKFKDMQDFTPGYEQDTRQLISSKLKNNLTQAITNKDIASIEALIKCWQVYGTEQSQMIDDVLQTIDKYYDLSSSLSQAQTDLDNNNNLLSEAKSQLNQLHTTESQYLTLEGFIVGDVGNSQYEFAFPEYNYFGRLPSLKHGLLQTLGTTYQSKGWFSLRVTKLTTTPVKLKEEYGNFTQDWPLYMEVSDYTIQQEAQQRQQYQTQHDRAAAAIDHDNSEIRSDQQQSDKEMALVLDIAQKIQ